MSLQIGDLAPDFKLISDENKVISLNELRGNNIVLYFYPKDNTPGCTKEACEFRNRIHEFQQNNAKIIGISKDNPLKHQKFKAKYALPFNLLADENADVCEAYGVINTKSLFGRSFLGITRSTFLIDSKGIIRAIWRKVKINGHTDEVLHELNNL